MTKAFIIALFIAIVFCILFFYACKKYKAVKDEIKKNQKINATIIQKEKENEERKEKLNHGTGSDSFNESIKLMQKLSGRK